jgi:hypothetical protein
VSHFCGPVHQPRRLADLNRLDPPAAQRREHGCPPDPLGGEQPMQVVDARELDTVEHHQQVAWRELSDEDEDDGPRKIRCRFFWCC